MLNTELMIRENALFKLIKLNKFKTPSNPIIDINFKDQYGYSAIEYAVLQANVEKGQSYINEGAQVTQDLFLSALRVGNLKVLK